MVSIDVIIGMLPLPVFLLECTFLISLILNDGSFFFSRLCVIFTSQELLSP